MEVISATDASSPMPEAFKKELLSMAYIYAIAAKAGANIYHARKDFGVDISFSKMVERRGRYTDTGSIPLHAQAKASKRWEMREGTIVYDLEADNYNDLVTSDGKCFLILMCLPSDAGEWLYQDETRLQLQKCCYYWYPSDLTETENSQKKRIFIPQSQIFTVDVLVALMEQAQGKVRL